MPTSPRLVDLRRRFFLAGVLVLCAVPALCARAAADTSAATTLADRYSPVIVVAPQTKPCGAGEAYRPTTVDILLGNPEVALRDARGKVVKRGPTAQELAAARAGDYIDLQGKPLSPGCFYEKQFQRWFGARKPTVYAHVATDSEHRGKLAVQTGSSTRSTTSPTSTRATGRWPRSTSMPPRRSRRSREAPTRSTSPSMPGASAGPGTTIRS